MFWWKMVRMPGKSHRGPLPPADDQLLQLAAELRRHVTVLAEEIGERNAQRRPQQLAQAADYYHTPEDTVDKLDFDRLARVVRGLRKVIEALVLA
jgi:hypothetical protein